jgi:hypothetical protein
VYTGRFNGLITSKFRKKRKKMRKKKLENEKQQILKQLSQEIMVI